MSPPPQHQPDEPLRESLWIRVGLTVVWMLLLLAVVFELRSTYGGRLPFVSTILLGPLGLLTVLQGFLLRGWPRRIASWCLLLGFVVMGFAILSLFFIIPPRWFPLVCLWIIAMGVWGVGIVWWLWGMRRAVIAWCVLPVVMGLSLLANRGTWDGRVDRIGAGDLMMGSSMSWTSEDPDVFALLGMHVSSFGNIKMVAATVGEVESHEVIDDYRDLNFVPQRAPGHAILAYSEYGTAASQSTIRYGTIAADGTIDLDHEVAAYGFIDEATLVMVETGGPWRVFPRLVERGDPDLSTSGATFLNRESGLMVHAPKLDHEWIFPTDSPDIFIAVMSEMVFDRATNTSTDALVMMEIDLTDGQRKRTLVRHDTPQELIMIKSAHPDTGVFFAPIPTGGAATGPAYPTIEFLDWETGALTVVARSVERENVRFTARETAQCVFFLEGEAWGTRLHAHDGFEEKGSVPLHPGDVLRDVAISPDGNRAAIVIGRGVLPGMIAQIYASQATLVWEFESDSLVEINAQSIAGGMMGFAPPLGGGESHRLQWSRDGRRVAHFSTGMRPFNTFNQWAGEVFVFYYGEWVGEE